MAVVIVIKEVDSTSTGVRLTYRLQDADDTVGWAEDWLRVGDTVVLKDARDKGVSQRLREMAEEVWGLELTVEQEFAVSTDPDYGIYPLRDSLLALAEELDRGGDTT